jgi:broad specificity phosphatase PhoE
MINKDDSSIEKIVYLIRHGQSKDNALPVSQTPESPLSERGLKQAEAIAARFSVLPFDKVISSPLPRAKQTAEKISEASGRSLEFSDLFVERIIPASLPGKPYSDPVARRTWEDWERSLVSTGFRVEEGENYQDIITRCDKAFEYLLQHPEKTLAVVSHSYFIRTLVSRVMGGDKLTPSLFQNLQRATFIDNTGVTVLVLKTGRDGKPYWKLLVHNDYSHLSVLAQ